MELETKKVEILETVFGLPDVDTALVAAVLALRTPAMVATIDRQLRGILSKHGITAIYPTRQHAFIISR